ncbi:MAG: hypothetical protein M3024_09545 [Candidatus Dormibacteraeota bacterium]|nr:hypothetical protein [Candidatus Dormibacteraeota bacterium]
MSATEFKERQATVHALEQVYQYISPGTNEGISFELSRLTDDLFTTSFLGGGDISLFTPGGHRGSIKSQSTQAYVLDSSGGAPAAFPFDLTLDLDTGKAALTFTLPSGPATAATLGLDYLKTVSRPEGVNLLFTADEASDDAAYTLSLILI